MFNDEERRLLQAFNQLDLTNRDNGIAFISFCNNVLARDVENRNSLFSVSAAVKRRWLMTIKNATDPNVAAVCSELYWSLLLAEARNHFLDSYLLYLEKNRRPKDRFYQPKRKCFLRIGLIQALQDLIDDKLDLLSISMPPGVGKTTVLKFFHSAVAGWYPEGFSLFWTHSDDIARMYYDGVYDIVSNDLEYTWHEIFPELEITKTNAKMEQFNVGAYKPFPSVQCTSTGAKNAGRRICRLTW